MSCPECGHEHENEAATECPDCSVPLTEEPPAGGVLADGSIAYGALVQLVREAGGQLKIDLSTTNVGKKRTQGFPWRGYKVAWAKSMQGSLGGDVIELETTDLGIKKTFITQCGTN